MTTATDRLVWIDCEMTGLDLERDRLVEIAIVVTDYDLNIVDPGLAIVIAADEAVLAQMGDFVRAMHTESAGNTIGTDRAFLAKYMPNLDAQLHYRSVDVSSIKELARRWYPRVYFAAPEKAGGHRALADILESIRELEYYRKAVFVAEPGPTSVQAKEVAANVVSSHSANM